MHISNLNYVHMFDFCNLCSANPLLSRLHIIHWKGLNGISSTQPSTPSFITLSATQHMIVSRPSVVMRTCESCLNFRFFQLNMGVVFFDTFPLFVKHVFLRRFPWIGTSDSLGKYVFQTGLFYDFAKGYLWPWHHGIGNTSKSKLEWCHFDRAWLFTTPN